jgi:AcrR family transcriptional regulator
MARIARASGVSKPLLYHYFPTKRELFEAVLAQAAERQLAGIGFEPGRPVGEQLAASLGGYLGWVEEHPGTYAALARSAGIPELHGLVDRAREEAARRIVEALVPGDAPAPPAVRAAVRGWLRSVDGVCLDWLRERDLTRADVHALLLGALAGALGAAGHDAAL